MSHTPWIGLAALVAMFVVPFFQAGCLKGRERSNTGRAGMSVVSVAPLGATGTPANRSLTSSVRSFAASFAGSRQQPN
jgi:hypothetical protein